MSEQFKSISETCRKIVASPRFNQCILALIVLSGILIGMETYPRFDVGTRIGKAIQFVQWVILWLFVAEAVIKIAAFGNKPWKYFQNPWNIFDFTIIVVCFLPLPIDPKFAMVFRMARLLRALRLLTALPRLQILVSALLKSIPALGYVGILLLLHFYIYAVMGTFLFRENDPVRFGNLQRSMLSLFQVVTLEGWNDVLHAQMFGSDVNYSDQWRALPEAAGRVSHGHPVAAPFYFVSFIMLGTMIMLNLFTGVIIGSMQEAEDQSSGKVADEVESHIKELEEKGFLTLREELEVVAHRLQEVAADVAALHDQTRELRPTRVGSAADPSGDLS
jgi:voltage-gated sodium channel